MKENYRMGVVGCGFWANYQIAAWHEFPEVKIVAICDSDQNKLKSFSAKFKIMHAYTDVRNLLRDEELDFVDVISSPETHPEIVLRAAEHKIPVICQKPMALELEVAKKMVYKCHSLNVPFYIHENFRWQKPMTVIKGLLDANEIGKPFKARVFFNTHFPVIRNQPALSRMEKLIMADLGVHLFDLVRFFFGEVKTIFCLTQKIDEEIKGEDVANTLLETYSGVHCSVEMSWASYVERDFFPQTLVSIEGNQGSISLSGDMMLKVIKPGGTRESRIAIPSFSWAHPDYAIVHSSLVPCNRDLLEAITGRGKSDNRADLNLETLKLVHAAYASASAGKVVNMTDFENHEHLS